MNLALRLSAITTNYSVRALDHGIDLGEVEVSRCPIADREHRKSPRQFMHVGHHPQVICYARAVGSLPEHHVRGLIAHELGHLVAERLGWTQRNEEYAANIAAERILGVKVVYLPPLMLQSARDYDVEEEN